MAFEYSTKQLKRILLRGRRIKDDEFRRDRKKWIPFYGAGRTLRRLVSFKPENAQFKIDAFRSRNILRSIVLGAYHISSLCAGIYYAAKTLSQLLE